MTTSCLISLLFLLRVLDLRLSEMVYVTVKTTLEECVADSSLKKVFGLTSAKRRHLHGEFQPQDSNMVDGNVSFSSALVSMSNEVFSECLKMIFEQISQLLMLLFGHGISRQGRYISV